MVGLRDDGIIHVYFKPYCEIDIETQVRILNACLKLRQKDSWHPVIFEGGEFISLSKEARKNAISIEKKQPAICFVLFVQNAAQRLLTNFYYKLNEPIKPLRIVKNFQEGIDWCLEMKEKFEAEINLNQ